LAGGCGWRACPRLGRLTSSMALLPITAQILAVDGGRMDYIAHG
jgi:hypothetical protein